MLERGENLNCRMKLYAMSTQSSSTNNEHELDSHMCDIKNIEIGNGIKVLREIIKKIVW